MSGRRTGTHFAWTCSAILAAGFPRECQIFFSLSLPKAGAGLSSRERGSKSAVMAQLIERAPAREHMPALLDQLALRRSTAALLDGGTPLPRRACPELINGSGHLTRRRDGRFHPRLRCEPGGLLHTPPGGTACESHARGSPSPSTLKFRSAERPSSEWGYDPGYWCDPAASRRKFNSGSFSLRR